MTHAVETMAYAGQVPWHGLGEKVNDRMSPEKMLKAAGLDWTVSKRDMFLADGAKVPNQYALCRDSDDMVLDIVGSKYRPVQNVDALDFFSKFVKAGHMKMETAGSLWNGRYVWGLARLGEDFALGREDEVRGFLLLSTPHIHGKAGVIQFTPVRVVCWNTITFALGSGLKGGAGAFRFIHSREFNDEVKRQAEKALGLGSEQMLEFKEAAQLLTKKRIKDVDEYFGEVLRYDPKDQEQRVPRMFAKFQRALEHAPGQQMATARGTLWGAYNAVTYVVDHETGRQRTTALRNAWLGHTAGIKRRALKIALDRAA